MKIEFDTSDKKFLTIAGVIVLFAFIYLNWLIPLFWEFGNYITEGIPSFLNGGIQIPIETKLAWFNNYLNYVLIFSGLVVSVALYVLAYLEIQNEKIWAIYMPLILSATLAGAFFLGGFVNVWSLATLAMVNTVMAIVAAFIIFAGVWVIIRLACDYLKNRLL